MRKIIVLVTCMVLASVNNVLSYDYTPYVLAHYGAEQEKAPNLIHKETPTHSLTAQIDGWNLIANTYQRTGAETENYLAAELYFSQQFEITAPGPASIDFHYERHLEIGNSPGDFGLESMFIIWDNRENTYTSGTELFNTGEKNFNDTITFNYDFFDFEVGDKFWLEISMDSILRYADDSMPPIPFKFASNNNSARILDVTGGLAPVQNVPVPGSLWLLGAGLLGLITFKQKNNHKL